jgi:hypothetical protein
MASKLKFCGDGEEVNITGYGGTFHYELSALVIVEPVSR